MMEKIGLIAGAGRFPILFAQEAKRAGNTVVAIGVEGITASELSSSANQIYYVPLGKLDQWIQIFKREGVKQVVMVGTIPHQKIFCNLSFDFRAIRLLATLRDRRANGILCAIAEELRSEGMDVIPSNRFLEHLLATPGVLTWRQPTAQERADAELGLLTARRLSSLDVGQTVVVSGGCVVAVEAMEGTDATIARAANMVNGNGMVVVKVARPRQDLRFDLPVVGLQTLEILEQSQASCLVVEAGKTVILDKGLVIDKANRARISLVAVEVENHA